MSNLSSNSKVAGNVTTVQTKLMWRIEKLGERCKPSIIDSPVFAVKTGNVITKWMMYLKAIDKGNQDSENAEEYLDIYLTSLNTETIRASFQFSIVGVFDKEVNLRQHEDCEFQMHKGWGSLNFLTRKLLVLVNVSIVCTITTNEMIKVESLNYRHHLKDSLRLEEFDRLGQLFYNKKFSDVVIVVEGKEIHVHKNFLANKSPVFEAMFTHDMSESNNNRVEISDVDYGSMFDMLKYIYTGIVCENLSENMYKDLVIVSEKYCIEILKHECEKKLREFLKIDNIFGYLNFSDKHNASYLKKEVIEFIVSHGEDIAALPSFIDDCSELNPDVYGEVFRAFAIRGKKVE